MALRHRLLPLRWLGLVFILAGLVAEWWNVNVLEASTLLSASSALLFAVGVGLFLMIRQPRVEGS